MNVYCIYLFQCKTDRQQLDELSSYLANINYAEKYFVEFNEFIEEKDYDSDALKFDTEEDKESNLYDFLDNDLQRKYYGEIKKCIRNQIVSKKIYESGTAVRYPVSKYKYSSLAEEVRLNDICTLTEKQWEDSLEHASSLQLPTTSNIISDEAHINFGIAKYEPIGIRFVFISEKRLVIF